MPKRKAVRLARTLQDYVQGEQRRSTVHLSSTTPEYRAWIARQMAKQDPNTDDKESDSA
jgi:hypothetical protein